MNDLDNVAIICKFGLVYKTTQTIRQVGLCCNVMMFPLFLISKIALTNNNLQSAMAKTGKVRPRIITDAKALTDHLFDWLLDKSDCLCTHLQH